jgi:hypothetical protein
MANGEDTTGAQATGAGDSAPSRDTEWLTAAEAAEYAGGVGISTIRQACNLNRLRHVRIGGGTTGPIRTRREWIAAWLEKWARGGDVAA